MPNMAIPSIITVGLEFIGTKKNIKFEQDDPMFSKPRISMSTVRITEAMR